MARLIAVALAIGVPLTAFLLQRPASQGEQGGLVLKTGGGVWFCSEGSTDAGISEFIDIVNPTQKISRGRYTVFDGDVRLDSQQLTVAPTGRTALDLDRELAGRPAGRQVGAVVEMDVTAAAVAETVAVSSPDATGTMAAPCTAGTSEARYYAGGTSLRGVDTYLLLFNPFPQDAVVNVDVFTDTGVEKPKNLQQFPLFAGRGAIVKLSEEVRRKSGIGAIVRAESGQVVSALSVYSNGERIPAGVALSPGVADPAPQWHFADGNTDLEQMLWILNPTDVDEEVEVEFYAEGVLTETPRSQTVRVPPMAETTMSIAPGLPAGTNFGFSATAARGTNLVVDRMIGYPASSGHGLSASPGMSAPMDRWVIANSWGATPGMPYATTLAVVNPGTVPAQLTIGRLADDEVAVPESLDKVTIAPNERVTIPVSQDFAGTKAMSLLGWSDRPLIVESRVSANSPRVGFEVMPATRLRPDLLLPKAVRAPAPAELTPSVTPDLSPSVENPVQSTPTG